MGVYLQKHSVTECYERLRSLTGNSFHQMSQNIVVEDSCRNLSVFRELLIGNTILLRALKIIYPANKMHICKLMFISFFHATRSLI